MMAALTSGRLVVSSCLSTKDGRRIGADINVDGFGRAPNRKMEGLNSFWLHAPLDLDTLMAKHGATESPSHDKIDVLLLL